MDCKLLICELLTELKAAKITYLEEELSWRGIDKKDISVSLKVLQERGIIYRSKSGVLELAEPAST
ncbi:MAG: hypothetical protein V1744_06315 [Candidatus Altiarchaeota archaeon]